MLATFCEEQVAASAESVKGEDTSAPLPGLLTVTVANAGLTKMRMDEPIESFWSKFIEKTRR
jgi:hypothetical protein